MSDNNQIEKAGLDRRKVMAMGTVGVAALAGGVLAANPAAAAQEGATQHLLRRLVVDVDTDGFADFSSPATDDGTGPFNVSGIILARGTATQIGTFQCWGFIRASDGVGLVNQEFLLDHKGSIIIAGIESDAPRAVTGGTRMFKRARGQCLPNLAIFDFMNTGKFRADFRLRSVHPSAIA